MARVNIMPGNRYEWHDKHCIKQDESDYLDYVVCGPNSSNKQSFILQQRVIRAYGKVASSC